MEDAISRIAPRVETQLSASAYSAEAVAPEWLTRLAVLMYLKDKNPNYLSFMLNSDHKTGIIWQKRALEYMDNFSRNRTQYSYFGDFMPQLVGFINFTADEIEKVVAEYENRRPYVINVFPAIGSTIDTTQGSIEFRVTFSEPMSTNSEGLKLLGNLDQLSEADIPQDLVLSEWVDERTYIVRLTGPMIRKGQIDGFTSQRRCGDFYENTKCLTLSAR